jgi:excisionase family DNA binding protein
MKSCKEIGGKYKMELLSIRETADLMGAKESTVRTWINRKQIPPVIVFRIGNTVRIKKDKLEKWVSDGSI